jgi:hypothetical protein
MPVTLFAHYRTFSCFRECREESHIPLRCDEVDKEIDVKMRTFVENAMAEALIRKCPSCSQPYALLFIYNSVVLKNREKRRLQQDDLSLWHLLLLCLQRETRTHESLHTLPQRVISFPVHRVNEPVDDELILQ